MLLYRNDYGPSSEQLLMWAAICSGSPQDTHMLHCLSVPMSSWMICSDRPMSVMCWTVQNRPVFSRYRSPLTPSPGSNNVAMYSATLVDPNACPLLAGCRNPCASFDRSSGTTLSISWASMLKGWRNLSLHGGTPFKIYTVVAVLQDLLFLPGWLRVAAFHLSPAGAIPAKTGSWNTGLSQLETTRYGP